MHPRTIVLLLLTPYTVYATRFLEKDYIGIQLG